MKTYYFKNRYNLISNIFTDVAHGQASSLIGLIDYLHIDHGYTIERLITIASRRFNIDKKELIRLAIDNYTL